MKIYTRTGDTGDTGLFGGGRVSKAHIRVAAYGTVDELNASLGVCREAVGVPEIRDGLGRIQNDLFNLGASLATPGSEDGTAKASIPRLPEARIQEMEEWIDAAMADPPELRSFILPGGSRGGAALHMARTVCRRAERGIVRLGEQEAVHSLVLMYLNRLSDLLFAWARLENWNQDVSDVLWEKEQD
ncbi:MAG: cob(I)yrinic acid a,c-diamide adenosyltransferase [Gemmatimonadetes bacterium]|nr:cob(I)yrinic acid a,c-diamide adenosyltransferase [Gemmatimonadota bacterium]